MSRCRSQKVPVPHKVPPSMATEAEKSRCRPGKVPSPECRMRPAQLAALSAATFRLHVETQLTM
jgi:hypothetical protein